MAAFALIRAKIVARFFCAAEVKADAPVAKTTLVVCGPVDPGGREACCIEFGVVFPTVLPATFPGASARGLGGVTVANDGATGGRENVTGNGGLLPVITFDLGFAGGTGASARFSVVADGRAEGVILRVGLRAILRGVFVDGVRFAKARRLRSSLGGTSFTVGSSLSRRPPCMGGRGANSLLTGIRLGGSRSRSPKLGRKTREAVPTLGPVPLSTTTLRSTSTSFE